MHACINFTKCQKSIRKRAHIAIKSMLMFSTHASAAKIPWGYLGLGNCPPTDFAAETPKNVPPPSYSQYKKHKKTDVSEDCVENIASYFKLDCVSCNQCLVEFVAHKENVQHWPAVFLASCKLPPLLVVHVKVMRIRPARPFHLVFGPRFDEDGVQNLHVPDVSL